MESVKFYEVNDGLDIIACHLDIEQAKKWYKKEYDIEADNIAEISPDDPILIQVDVDRNNMPKLQPTNKCSLGEYTEFQGCICKKVKFIDKYKADGSPSEPYLIGGTDW